MQVSSSNSEHDSKGQDQKGGGADQSGQNGQWSNNVGVGQSLPVGAAGFDGTNGGFPSMGGFTGAGDFSQMMQLMPNAMPNSLMSAFPNMMGMFDKDQPVAAILKICKQVCQEWGWTP